MLVAASERLGLWAAIAIVALVLYAIHQHERNYGRKIALKEDQTIRDGLGPEAEEMLRSGSIEQIEQILGRLDDARDRIVSALSVDAHKRLTLQWSESDVYTAYVDDLIARLEERRDELGEDPPATDDQVYPRDTFAEWSSRHRPVS
jgi:hypothetical protein